MRYQVEKSIDLLLTDGKEDASPGHGVHCLCVMFNVVCNGGKTNQLNGGHGGTGCLLLICMLVCVCVCRLK